MNLTARTTRTVTTETRSTYVLDGEERIEAVKKFAEGKRVLIDVIYVTDTWTNGTHQRKVSWTGNRLLKDGKIGSAEHGGGWRSTEAPVRAFAAERCPIPHQEPTP